MDKSRRSFLFGAPKVASVAAMAFLPSSRPEAQPNTCTCEGYHMVTAPVLSGYGLHTHTLHESELPSHSHNYTPSNAGYTIAEARARANGKHLCLKCTSEIVAKNTKGY